jgi:hypothetical protein
MNTKIIILFSLSVISILSLAQEKHNKPKIEDLKFYLTLDGKKEEIELSKGIAATTRGILTIELGFGFVDSEAYQKQIAIEISHGRGGSKFSTSTINGLQGFNNSNAFKNYWGRLQSGDQLVFELKAGGEHTRTVILPVK